MTDYSVLPALVDERLAGGRLTIDLDALVANWNKLDSMAPNSRTSAVVKANAYGLGTEPVVQALWDAGCDTFFVAVPEEGVRVRRQLPEARIYVLGGLFKDAASTYAEANLTPVLGCAEDVERWSEFWRVRSQRKPCAVHTDTGMTRLGLSAEEVERLFGENTKYPVTPILLMTHPACADDPAHPLNAKQLANFQNAERYFTNVDRSMANSAGIIAHPNFHFELNRPGIAMYGGEAVNDLPNPMAPVVTLEARIIQIRKAAKGECVGYGATQELKRNSKIAIVSVGYADGYLRSSSFTGVPLRNAPGNQTGGFGWMDGYKVPLAGRVSMDLTAFDVTDVPEQVLESAEWIELFGNNILVDDAARAAGTIGYEMLTGLSPRYSRSYLKQNTE